MLLLLLQSVSILKWHIGSNSSGGSMNPSSTARRSSLRWWLVPFQNRNSRHCAADTSFFDGVIGSLSAIMQIELSVLRASPPPFAHTASEVHANRCNEDLLYALFERPEGEAPRPSGANARKSTAPQKLVDWLIGICLDVMERSAAPFVQDCREVMEVHAILRGGANDDTPFKTFYILFALAKQPAVQELFRRGYAPNVQQWWGDRANQHLAEFVVWLQGRIEACLNHPASELDVAEVFRNTVHAARKKYIMT